MLNYYNSPLASSAVGSGWLESGLEVVVLRRLCNLHSCVDYSPLMWVEARRPPHHLLKFRAPPHGELMESAVLMVRFEPIIHSSAHGDNFNYTDTILERPCEYTVSSTFQFRKLRFSNMDEPDDSELSFYFSRPKFDDWCRISTTSIADNLINRPSLWDDYPSSPGRLSSREKVNAAIVTRPHAVVV